VSAIEDRDLKADFCAKPALRGIHNPMHWGLRILTGLEQIQRLKEHTAETAQIAYQCVKFRILARREMLGVLEGRIQVELKSNLHNPVRSILDIERVVVEAHLPRGNHVAQGLLVGKYSLENKWNRHGKLLIIKHDCKSTEGWSKRLSSKAAASEEARRTLRYVEPLSDARTKLECVFTILLLLHAELA
jgi:hypothetical protein